MEKQLGWTTIEQSKKLIELGIDINTADMWYQCVGMSFENSSKKPIYFPMITRDYVSKEDIPCWSLGALINLMQPFYPAIDFESNDLWNISICAISELFSNDEGYDIHIKEKLLVDACVKTIIVLVEHNEIKQAEQND